MSSEQALIRILVVDDHPIVRQGIAVLVGTQTDMTLVAEASNGREAIQQFREHRPDITLMDLQMPEMNGLDAMAAIRGEFPDAKIIVLTTYTGDVQILRAFKNRSLRLSSEKYISQRTAGHHPRRPCWQEERFPLKLPTRLLSTPLMRPSPQPKSAC